MHLEGGKNRGCVKIHIQIHSVSKNLKPLCTRIIAFTVLNAVKQIKQSHKNWEEKKTKQKTPETAYLKSHHNNPIYYHPFRQFLFISHIYILGQFLSPENLWGKQGSGSQAEDRKEMMTKRLILQKGCAWMVTFLHTAYCPTVHESGTKSSAFTASPPRSQ